MFKNLKLVYIGPNDLLAYNDEVAGLFNDYRTTANNAIHQLENRKLNKNEIDQFLDEIDQIENVDDDAPTEETDRILHKIVKICPEIKYMVHGFKLALAAGKKRATPEERQEKTEQMNKDRKAREEALKKRLAKENPKPKPKPKQERIRETPTEKKKRLKDEQRKKEETTQKQTEEEEAKKRADEAEQYRLAEEEKMQKEHEESDEYKRVEKGEKELKDTGKAPTFTGFKGLLFDMYKNVFVDKMDPKNKAEREELQRRLKRDWAMYQKNKKLFDTNRGLVKELSDRLENQDIEPETISLIQELAARHPEEMKNIDLSSTDANEDIRVWLVNLGKKYKDININEKDKGRLEKNIKTVIEKKEGFKVDRVHTTDKKDREFGRQIIIEVSNWNDWFRLKNELDEEELAKLSDTEQKTEKPKQAKKYA